MAGVHCEIIECILNQLNLRLRCKVLLRCEESIGAAEKKAQLDDCAKSGGDFSQVEDWLESDKEKFN